MIEKSNRSTQLDKYQTVSRHSERLTMMTEPLRILTYTNLFPNYLRPNTGIFIKNRIEAFLAETQSQLDVVAPVPYFPKLPWQTRWDLFSRIQAEEKQGELRVYHPRYIVIPKVGMLTHGYSMYLATHKLVHHLHQRNCYHLIDAHWLYPDGWAAVKIAKKLNLPVILSARGNDINEYIDFPEIRPSITWCLKNCDHIVSVCQSLKDLMLPLGIPDSKITVIGNGVDTKKFYPIHKDEARRQLALPLNRRILLSVGGLEPRKGHHILIEALRLLRAQQVELPRLYVVGSGIFYDKLESLVLKYGLDNDVTLVGEIHHKELKVWYSAADVLCLASDREGWPNVLLESIACGTPVVASKVYGVPEVITSEDIGLLAEQRTPEAFTIQILKALRKVWESEKLVEFAKQHSWEKTAYAVQEVFLKILNPF